LDHKYYYSRLIGFSEDEESTSLFYFYFFFSSRRRHTRWPRDWSSDVCSSDLAHVERASIDVRPRGDEQVEVALSCEAGTEPIARSEERRVGKECRSREWPYH